MQPTSDLLAVSQALSTLATQKPTGLTGAASGVWDDLINLIKSAVQSIINGANSTISGWITNAVSAIKTKIGEVSTWINGVSNSVYKYLFDANTGVVKLLGDKINTVVQGVIDGVNQTLGGIGDAISGAIGRVVDAINNVIDAVKGIGTQIGNAIAGVIQSVGEWVKNAIQNVLEGVGSVIYNAVQDIGNWIGTIAQNIKDAIDNFKKGVSDVIDGVKEWINNAIQAVKDWLSDVYTRAKTTIEDAFNKFLAWLAQTVGNLVAWKDHIFGLVNQWVDKNILPLAAEIGKDVGKFNRLAGPIGDAIFSGNYQKAFDLLDSFFTDIGLPAPVHVLYGILSMFAYFSETIKLQFVPMEVAASKRANIALGLDPISIDLAAQGVYRGIASKADFINNAALGGVAVNRANLALEAGRPLPSPGSVQQAFLRKEITEAEHDHLLAGYGYTKENIELFKALYFLIPNPADLIRMGVREVFTPEIAEKFGQFQDIPPAFLSWGKKIGLSEQWATNYWAAHWELPSAEMGFDMLHRGIVSKEELTLLLRALDVMPFWREKIIQLSYNPLTRVDVRRMYQSGVIGEDQVHRAYLDLGYNEEKAGWLTEFTKRYYTPEDQSSADEFISLARSTYSQAYKNKLISQDEYREFLLNLKYHPDDVNLLITLDDIQILGNDKLFDINDQRKSMRKLILAAYNDGLIENDLALSMLMDLGYEQSEANLELGVVDYNVSLQTKTIVVNAMHDQFIGYMIDEVGLHELMGMWNFSGLEIDHLIDMWNIEKSFRTKRPSLTDLRRFLTQGLLTMDQFLDELRGLGYHEKYIGLYQASIERA